jgi:hypothetical protein
MHQKVQKTLFFVEYFDKKCLTLSKKNQKSPFKHFRLKYPMVNKILIANILWNFRTF